MLTLKLSVDLRKILYIYIGTVTDKNK